MSSNIKSIEKPRISLKVQTLAAAAAIAGAVILPQIFHAVGAVSGLGTALGEVFLPMHLPIILAGLLAGPFAGAAAGLLGPLLSHLMTGMPVAGMLPFMMIELCAYGALAGILRNTKMPCVLKTLIVQFGGRLIRAAAIFTAVYALGSDAVNTAVIWRSIVSGIPGLILQWTFIPLIIYRIENAKKHER